MTAGKVFRTQARSGVAVGALALAAAVFVAALAGCASTVGVAGRLQGSAVAADRAIVNQAVADDLERSAQMAMKKMGIRGLAMTVVADDGSSWSAGFGSAGGGRAVTPETPFVVASVTKLFTAVAVMKLVEDGLVGLDEPIGKYVSEMAGRSYPGSRPPTVRDLLTHHGGIVSDTLKGNFYDGPEAGYTTAFMTHVPLIAEQALTEPPRMLAHYSNAGYVLLGALVARVSGEPYAEFVERTILRPLGMLDSGFLDPAARTALSAGFASGKEVLAPRVSGGPEGGLAASAVDLGRFISMILAGTGHWRGAPLEPVLSAATMGEMLSRQNVDIALDFDFEMGLGFRLMSLPGYPDVRLVWHDGGNLPFASTLVVAPEQGVGVAIVSNTDEKVPEDLAFEAIERVLRERNWAGPARAPGYQFGEMAGRPLEQNELAGTYMSEVGAVVVGGTPEAPEAGLFGMKLRVVGREQQSYGLQYRLLGLVPLRIADLERLRVVFREIDGRRVMAIYEGGKFRSVALEVESRPVPAAWQARYGHYVVANPDPVPFLLGADLGFDEKLGFMTISVTVAASPDPYVFPVLALDDETLVTAGLGRRMGERMRVEVREGREAIVWGGLALQRP